MNPWPRTFAGRLWLLVAVACVVRVAFVWQVRATLAEPGGYALAPGTDMVKYVRYARMVLQGDWLAENVMISPLAPLVVLPALLMLGGGHLVGAMLWQGVFGSLAVVLIGLIGRRYLTEAGALVAAGLAAVYAPFIVHDAVPLTETTITVCFLLTWWAYLRLRENPTAGRAVITGVAWGLAIAAKPTMAVVLPALVLGECVGGGGRWVWRARSRLAVAALGMGVVITPFILRAHGLSGEWLFVRGQTAYLMLQGNHPTATGLDRDIPPEMRARFKEAVGEGPGYYRRRDAVALRWVIDFWTTEPAAALRLLARKVGWLFSAREIQNNIAQAYYEQQSILGYPVFVGAGIVLPLAGLGLVIQRGRLRNWWTVLVPLVGYAGLIVATVVSARLRLPLVPGMMLLAAAALVWLYHEGQRLDRRRWLAIGAVVASMLALNEHALARWWQPTIRPTGQREPVAGGWLHRDGPWDMETAYSAWIDTTNGVIRKRLFLADASRPPSAAVEIRFRCVVSGAGVVRLRLNDCERLMTFASEMRGQNLMAVCAFPVSCLRSDNQISFQVEPGTRLRMFYDDDWWYGRSALQDAGEDFFHDSVEDRTHRPPRTIRGEFQVGLFLRD